MNNDAASHKKLIRENMEQKETEELVEIYELHDTAAWTPEALEIVGEILSERGITLYSEVKNLTRRKNIPLWIDDELPEEEKTPLDLSRINWSEDSIETVYSELSRRTISNSIWTEMDEEHLSFSDDTFNCVVCGTEIHWGDRFCKECGLELFPGKPLQEEPGIATNASDESEIETIAAKLRGMSTQELCNYWFEFDPLEWERNELAALRRVFSEQGLTPAYLMDAPADAIRRLPYFSIESLIVRGTPGFRLRPGRCGLDYLDTTAEEYRVIGSIIRDLFKPASENQWSIFTSFFVGILLIWYISPIVLLFTARMSFTESLYSLGGIFILITAFISLKILLQKKE